MNEEQIIQKLCDSKFEVNICGGAVRDILLGKVPKDYDIITNATPEQLNELFKTEKVSQVGMSFLVTIINNIDVATYRKDYNFDDGRNNCQVSYTNFIEEDLKRRDFTINAMVMCPFTGKVVDHYNGRQDLKNKIVKFIGNPYDRIREDYLRMIRAARFVCLIEGKIDTVSALAIETHANLIQNVAPERIRIELMKVMTYKKPSLFFECLHQLGLLKYLFPDMVSLINHTGGIHHNETVWEHCMICGDLLSSKNPLLRLAGFLHDIGKPESYKINNDGSFKNHEIIGSDKAKDILSLYKFSTKEKEFVTNIISVHMRSITNHIKPKAVRKLIKKLHELNLSWKSWLQLQIADNKANLKTENLSRELIRYKCLEIRNCFKEPKRAFSIKDLDISGHDIMNKLSLNPGPEIGKILKDLLDKVLENPELNNKNDLLKEIQ